MESREIIVDTSLLIDHFRSRQKNTTILYQLSEKYILSISSVTQFEFLVGAKKDQMAHIKEILDGMQILPFDSVCAEIASDIAKSLKTKHQHTEFRDIFIAATAISGKLPLSTLNFKHFKKIERLELLKDEEYFL